jgi:hypothetical protein
MQWNPLITTLIATSNTSWLFLYRLEKYKKKEDRNEK